DCSKVSDTLGQRLPDRDPLRADGETECAVLDVAAAPDSAFGVFDRRPDGKSAVLAERAGSRIGRRGDELVLQSRIDHFRTSAAIFGTAAVRRRTNRAPTRSVVFRTSACTSG